MSTHNICFYGEIRKKYPRIPPNTPKQFLCVMCLDQRFLSLGLVEIS